MNNEHRNRIERMRLANVALFEEYLNRLSTPVATGTDKEKDELQALNLKIAMRKELENVSQSIEAYQAQLDLIDGKEAVAVKKSTAISPESMAANSKVK